jgi:quercetin dioxygenase-like cupin family protein
MEGELELTLGGKSQVLKPGESVSFDSETPHKLVSASDRMTRCLVVLYTP